MPTATSFTFDIPWEQIVGVFNSIAPMYAVPVVIAVGLILVSVIAGAVVSFVKRARGGR